jgi:hypothetical protein
MTKYFFLSLIFIFSSQMVSANSEAPQKPMKLAVLTGPAEDSIRYLYQLQIEDNLEKTLSQYADQMMIQVGKSESAISAEEKRLILADLFYWLGRLKSNSDDVTAPAYFRMADRYYYASKIQTSIFLNNHIGSWVTKHQLQKLGDQLSPSMPWGYENNTDAVDFEQQIRNQDFHAQRAKPFKR